MWYFGEKVLFGLTVGKYLKQHYLLRVKTFGGIPKKSPQYNKLLAHIPLLEPPTRIRKGDWK